MTDPHTRLFFLLWLIIGGLMGLMLAAAAWLVWRAIGPLDGVRNAY